MTFNETVSLIDLYWWYRAEIAEQDQTARMCSLILLYTFRKNDWSYDHDKSRIKDDHSRLCLLWVDKSFWMSVVGQLEIKKLMHKLQDSE